MAWRHRNDPHQHQYHNHHRPTGYGHNTMSSGYSRPFSGNYPHSSATFFRPSSPSVTTSSSDDREEVPMVRHPPRRPYSRGSRLNHHGGSSHSLHHVGLGHLQTVPSIMDNYHMHPMHGGPGPNHMGTFRNGTLRSTRSVPALALATWDGEPCPVHGGGPPVFPPSGPPTMRRYGSLFDVRAHGGPPMLYPPPPPSVMMDKKSMHGSMQMLAMPFPPPHGYPPPSHQGHGPPSGGPFPPHFLAPTLMRGRPMVIPAGAEPLPIRDPFKLRTPPPQFVAKMDEDDYTMDQVCCKGHLIVLWIILGVVTVGVILGIILGVTIA